MNNMNGLELNDQQARRLLDEVDQLEAELIQPLTNEEVAAIEAGAEPISISPERDTRQRQTLEELRQELLHEVQPIDSLVARSRALGLTLPAFAQRLRLDPEVIANLDYHLVLDVPRRAIAALAEVLQLDLSSLYVYLAPSAPILDAMAAASRGKPAPGQPQTWEQVIRNSQMPPDDKAYWLQAE